MNDRILIYNVDSDERAIIESYFTGKYETVDVSTCFSDLLAIPADMIFMNPNSLSGAEVAAFNELFGHELDMNIIFTQKPDWEPEFLYYVEDDIAHLDGKSFEVEEAIGLAACYETAVSQKDSLLKEIEAAIIPKDETLSTESKTMSILNRCLLFRQALELIENIDNLRARDRVAYRRELMDAFLSMKLACGLIEIDDVMPFDGDDNVFNDEEEWIVKLADSFRTKWENVYKPQK